MKKVSATEAQERLTPVIYAVDRENENLEIFIKELRVEEEWKELASCPRPSH